MAGYLDTYGAEGERRERRGKLIVRTAVWGLIAAVVAIVLFFTFRTWRQERVMKQFISLLDQKDYQGAYKLWGCTPETPCKGYPPEKFTEDWGPTGIYQNVAAAKIEHTDFCDAGVVFSLKFPNADPIGLWVDRDTNVLGFAPWPRCPGPHFQFWEMLKAKFS